MFAPFFDTMQYQSYKISSKSSPDAGKPQFMKAKGEGFPSILAGSR